jgi:hypothetical protein
MAEVVQKLVIDGPKTWQEWYNSLAIFSQRVKYDEEGD